MGNDTKKWDWKTKLHLQGTKAFFRVTSDFGLPNLVFRLRTSDFRLPTLNFLPTKLTF
jgi:hypothetical protein